METQEDTLYDVKKQKQGLNAEFLDVKKGFKFFQK